MRKILIVFFCLIALNAFAENVLFKYTGSENPDLIVPDSVRVITIGDNVYLSGERQVIESLFDNSTIKEIQPPERELKSIPNLNGWVNLTTQSGYSQMDYIYRVLSLPSSMENLNSTSLRICLEGSSGDTASIDAVRVSASDAPDAFAMDSGTSMSTPFVTAAAALGYSYFEFYSEQDLLSNSETINTSKGNVKKLNLYQYLTSITPVGASRYVPDDEFFDIQWGLDASNDSDIDWPEGIFEYESKQNANPPIVVVMDSGIAWNHPDLESNILTGGDFGNYGFEFCDNESITNYDDIGHGTHVAGIIGAVTDNTFGVAGVGNNNVKILNMRVICDDSDKINFVAELSAIQKILELKNQGHNIKFVNMSFGGVEYLSDEAEALQQLTDKGIHLFSAAGNVDPNEPDYQTERTKPDYPAGYDNVTAVGSLNESSDLSRFSKIGNWVDIYAPGERIYSTYAEYLAKPSSLNLISNYSDVFRNEFDTDSADITFSGGWFLDGAGHAEITLDSLSSCGDTATNYIEMGPFDPDLPEYRYKNIVLSLKASSGAIINVDWYNKTTDSTNNNTGADTNTNNTETNSTSELSSDGGGGGGGCSIAGSSENNNIVFLLAVLAAFFWVRKLISAKRKN